MIRDYKFKQPYWKNLFKVDARIHQSVVQAHRPKILLIDFQKPDLDHVPEVAQRFFELEITLIHHIEAIKFSNKRHYDFSTPYVLQCPHMQI